MGRDRRVPDVMEAPSHKGEMKPCVMMTETAVSTIGLEEGHFACVVFSRPDLDNGAVVVLDRDEWESMKRLMDNAMEDAERADRGEPMIHASPSARTH